MANRKIGALWTRTSKEGKKYLSGVLQDLSGDIRIAVFLNDRKEKDNEPDYNILLSEQKKEQTTNKPNDFLNNGEVAPGSPMGPAEEEVKVEDIPF